MGWEKDGLGNSWYDASAPAFLADLSFCSDCKTLHRPDVSCEVTRARHEAIICEPGEELREGEELAGVDRVELLKCLRHRGLALEVIGEGKRWKVVEVLA